ncbi:DUF2145 domain-containing protein [Polaromonas jejuensis]|uniref:DUF2145 domain-containing protein n=1 Tax=Polaromonas jejuensis TaxID=457502 RepID=A0ABW0QGR4_9BURK|nr:DUF2145 domain-containing protein [Polaromonas jejuensis]
MDIGSHALMFTSNFAPLVHLDDHPEEHSFALKLQISLPSTVEAFVREQRPGCERVEPCQDGKQVVVQSGWTPRGRRLHSRATAIASCRSTSTRRKHECAHRSHHDC